MKKRKNVGLVALILLILLVIYLFATRQKPNFIETSSFEEYVSGLTLCYEYYADVDGDGADEIIAPYIAAERMDDGTFALDDGQDWAIIIRKQNERICYPIFPKKYVQLGEVNFETYQVGDEKGLRILVHESQTAGLVLYEIRFNQKKEKYERNEIYNPGTINYIMKSGW